MIELKQEVNDLAAQLGQPRPYALAFMDAAAAQIVRSRPSPTESPLFSEQSQTSNRKEQSQ
jgi:adenine-specific DNA glycosylase